MCVYGGVETLNPPPPIDRSQDFQEACAALLILTWFHVTAVRRRERGKDFCCPLLVLALQILVVGFLLAPQFDPEVLADAVQRVSGEQETKRIMLVGLVSLKIAPVRVYKIISI